LIFTKYGVIRVSNYQPERVDILNCVDLLDSFDPAVGLEHFLPFLIRLAHLDSVAEQSFLKGLISVERYVEDTGQAFFQNVEHDIGKGQYLWEVEHEAVPEGRSVEECDAEVIGGKNVNDLLLLSLVHEYLPEVKLEHKIDHYQHLGVENYEEPEVAARFLLLQDGVPKD
jgi:hypothetical protein